LGFAAFNPTYGLSEVTTRRWLLQIPEPENPIRGLMIENLLDLSAIALERILNAIDNGAWSCGIITLGRDLIWKPHYAL
jgi:hypothetical protein